eukprot:c8232_g1_i1.p1 GENE.c8232_g1_i1~~c8232_g1_i1.p1  ORF type:complete len:673 (+),score=94.61 c8232_g1_i1:76-2094(+)
MSATTHDTDKDRDVVVWAKGVTVTLGNNKVLNKLDFQLLGGNIFCLLGPSGCGKTTLVKTLLGVYSPDEGESRVLGLNLCNQAAEAGAIGYAPQNLGLHTELTVQEHLVFYATIAGMQNTRIANTIDELSSLFKLGHQLSTLVSQLSFGEQKIVNFCTTVVATPKFIVLDEPTVGVDPVRRDLIWAHLSHLRGMQRTIIISTHHINEANKADTVGILRDGRFHVCAPPNELVKAMNETSLERAYLASFELDVDVSNFSAHADSTPPPPQVPEHVLRTAALTSCVRFVTTENYRKRKVMFFAILLSLFEYTCILFCLGSLTKDMPASVVNNDVGLYGDQFVSILTNGSRFQWDVIKNCASCLDDQISLVRSQRLLGTVLLPDNFTSNVQSYFTNRNAPIPLTLFYDRTDPIPSDHIAADVYESFLLMAFSKSPDVSLIDPSHVVERIREIDSMVNFFAVNVFVIGSFLVGTTIVMSFLLQFKFQEVDERLRCNGMPMYLVVLAVVLVAAPALIFEFPLRFLMLLSRIEGPFFGHVPLLFALCTLSTLCGASHIILVVSLSSTQMGAILASYASTILMSILLSGGGWPVAAQPMFLQILVKFNPVSWVMIACRAIIMRDRGITHPDVIRGFVIPCVYLVVALSLATSFMKSRTPVSTRLRQWTRRHWVWKRRSD